MSYTFWADRKGRVAILDFNAVSQPLNDSHSVPSVQHVSKFLIEEQETLPIGNDFQLWDPQLQADDHVARPIALGTIHFSHFGKNQLFLLQSGGSLKEKEFWQDSIQQCRKMCNSLGKATFPSR